MKRLICGSKYIDGLEEGAVQLIKSYMKNGCEIFVGDDANGIDTLIQSVLKGYDKVTVYSPFEEARVNLGNWSVIQAGDKERRAYRSFYFAKDAKMAYDADHALVIWNGKSIDVFINMLNMVLTGKSFLLYNHGKNTHKVIDSLEQLEYLIPKNTDYVSGYDNLPKELYEPVIRSCGFSKEMEEYLIKTPVCKSDVYDIILDAPVSLEKKKEILKPLLKTDNLFQELYYLEERMQKDVCYNEKSDRAYIAEDFLYQVLSRSFSKLYYEICRAIKEQNMRKGEFLIVNSCDYDIDIFDTDRHVFAPFTSFESAMSAIKEDIRYEMDEDFAEGESIRWWYEIEKWEPIGDGNFEKTYTYFVDRDDILYFERHDKKILDLNEYKPCSSEEDEFNCAFGEPTVDVFFSKDFFFFLYEIIKAVDKDYKLDIEDFDDLNDFEPFIEKITVTESIFRAVRKMYVEKDVQLLEQFLYVIMEICSAFGIGKKNKDVTRIHTLDIEGRIPLKFRFMNDTGIVLEIEEEKTQSDSILDEDDGDGIFTADNYEQFRDEPSEFRGYIRGGNLNLPISFKPGDIVTLDVMPFSDRKYAVITDILNQYDCCAVQILFYDEKSKLYVTGALKHARGLNPDTILSPLYRLEKYDAELDDNEMILKDVGRHIFEDKEKGEIFIKKVKAIQKLKLSDRELSDIVSDDLKILNRLSDKAVRREAVSRMKRLNEVIAGVEGLNDKYYIGPGCFSKLDELSFYETWQEIIKPILEAFVEKLDNRDELMKMFEKTYGEKTLILF